MGSCKSILYYEEDEDDKKIREKAEQVANDLKEFQSKLKKQRGQYSELDLSGKGVESKRGR